MTLAASGAISLADIRTEYVGGSGSISLGDLYRGGSNVKAKSGDNQATNLAASVPTSGVIDLADFHGTAKGFKFIYSSTHGNQNFSSLFGDDWDLNYPKIVDINSGVSIYGSGTDAITIPSGLAGGLTLNNAGTIYGFGGAANGGAGGNCINNAASGVVINNTANIFAGGGGGGQGGTGGGGSYTSTTRQPSSGSYYHQYFTYWMSGSETTFQLFWFVSQGGQAYYGGYNYTPTTYTTGGWTYYRGTQRYSSSEYNIKKYEVHRQQTSTTSTSGGAGGAGGVGQGYNVTNASGSSGAAGGTSAGTGGTGGAGATYGQAGSAGSTGSNGNASNGSGGSSGGAAGAAVTGVSVSMNNTGTIYGAVA